MTKLKLVKIIEKVKKDYSFVYILDGGNKVKTLIWGTGSTYRILQETIKLAENDGTIDIVGLVNNTGEKKIDGYTVYSLKDISKLEFDIVLIAAEGMQADSIMLDIDNIVPDNKIKSCSKFLIEKGYLVNLHEKVVEYQCKVLNDILNATDEQVESYEWMYNKIAEYGVYPFEKDLDKKVNRSEWGLQQIIDEFAKYCNYIATIKVESAIEIGVFKGRSSYFMCALLSRKNPKLKYTCVDIYDNLDSYDEYKTILPALEKCIPSTSEDYIGKVYDFVFIDADHSYDGSMRDYRNVGQYANNITVFHDIYGHEYDELNGGVPRTWREVVEETKDHEHLVFSKYLDKWMGIGVVKWNKR